MKAQDQGKERRALTTPFYAVGTAPKSGSRGENQDGYQRTFLAFVR